MTCNDQTNDNGRSKYYGAMQKIVDALFEVEETDKEAEIRRMLAEVGVEDETLTVRRLDVVMAAESADLCDDLIKIVNLLPPGNYTRRRLCDQLNSAITGHAWGSIYGTVS
ncbi:MAG: hypothetical protein LUB61_01135 [Eggerthellaceae bacterium]|nr:hypothetical protein [Eggerthellaceae bacterium]